MHMLTTLMNDSGVRSQIRFKWLFCVSLQDPNQAKVAQESGAAFAGGVELIQRVS